MSVLPLPPCMSAGECTPSKASQSTFPTRLSPSRCLDLVPALVPWGCTSSRSLHNSPNLHPVIITPFIKSFSNYAHLTALCSFPGSYVVEDLSTETPRGTFISAL